MDTTNWPNEIDITDVNTKEERAKAIATLVIVCAANVANVLGFAFDADIWINAALSIISVISVVYAWWKNQNITVEAMQAQKILGFLKAEAKHAKETAEKE